MVKSALPEEITTTKLRFDFTNEIVDGMNPIEISRIHFFGRKAGNEQSSKRQSLPKWEAERYLADLRNLSIILQFRSFQTYGW